MREAAPLRPAGILRRAAVAALAAAAVAAGSPAVAAGDGAPAGEVLSLERAIDLALAGNRQLRAAGAGVDAAVAGGDEARAESRPRLDLAAVYQRTDNPVLVFGNLLGQERFGAGNFAVDRLNRPAPLDNWKTRLSVRQPLWTAGRIRHGVAAAEGLARAAADEHEALRQQIAERTIAAYAAAVLAGHELELSRQALLTAEEHLRLVRNLHEGGLVVESDVLQAEVRVSEVRELVIRAETGLEIRRGELNLILGRAPETPVRLAETLPAEEAAEDQESDLASLVAAARAARADLRAAR
ncbi:MAG: TolC family protein, partial [Acidobacteria bacterium]